VVMVSTASPGQHGQHPLRRCDGGHVYSKTGAGSWTDTGAPAVISGASPGTARIPSTPRAVRATSTRRPGRRLDRHRRPGRTGGWVWSLAWTARPSTPGTMTPRLLEDRSRLLDRHRRQRGSGSVSGLAWNGTDSTLYAGAVTATSTQIPEQAPGRTPVPRE